jgi:hypothetical protein
MMNAWSVQQMDPEVEATKRHKRKNSDGGPPEEALSAVDLLLFVVLDLIREAVKHITSWGETGVEARIDFSRFSTVKAKADGLG